MQLSSMRYMEQAPPPVHSSGKGGEEFGWTELSKGLFSVLGGYILFIFNGIGGLVLLWICTAGFRRATHDITGDDLTVFLIGGGVLFFSSLYSSYLVLRGKWRCMMAAPDRHAARWMMFVSMLCICAGPAINFASRFVGVAPAKFKVNEVEVHRSAAKVAALYAESLRDNDMAAYMKLGGVVIAPFGPIFFVLFLRAMYNCMGHHLAARFTELYLLFVVLLAAGTASLLLDARVHIRIDLLLILGLGWLMALLWYFLLIVAAAMSITARVNTQQPAVTY
jgi:hypothetical protein